MVHIAKLLRVTTSIETLSHQFVQRCSVSGTAKGKAKIKAGQTLKRGKVTIGKKNAAPVDAPKGFVSEKEKLYDQCLKAPSPVRYLSPKDKAREAEREKLGLISPDRQRELDLLKKGGKKAMGISDEPMILGTPGFDYISLGLVDEDELPKYELTAEDGKRLAKEYSRFMMRKHRARQAAESTLLRFKKEAIEALPEPLKSAALVPDLSPFPANRFMATLTPPIEGYIDKVKEAASRSTGTEKVR
ncbi:hypothetical protein ACFE04_006406 [Oxalis oulophora]